MKSHNARFLKTEAPDAALFSCVKVAEITVKRIHFSWLVKTVFLTSILLLACILVRRDADMSA